MPAVEGKATDAPTPRPLPAFRFLLGEIQDLSEWTSDWLQVVLTEGDLDDWSRESLGHVLRYYKGIGARMQVIADDL